MFNVYLQMSNQEAERLDEAALAEAARAEAAKAEAARAAAAKRQKIKQQQQLKQQQAEAAKAAELVAAKAEAAKLQASHKDNTDRNVRDREKRSRSESSDSSSSSDRSRHRRSRSRRRRYSRDRSRGSRHRRSRERSRSRRRSYRSRSRFSRRRSHRSRSRSRTYRRRSEYSYRRSRSRSRRRRSPSYRSLRYSHGDKENRYRDRTDSYEDTRRRERTDSYSRRRERTDSYVDNRSGKSVASSVHVVTEDKFGSGMEDSRVVVNRDSYESDSEDEEMTEGDLERNSRFAKRLLLVRDICKLDIPEQEEEEQTTFDTKDTLTPIKLPPAEGFKNLLNGYMKEARGAKGSKRAKKDSKLPLEVGRLVSRNRPNVSAVESHGQPWLMAASPHNSCLTSNQAFKFNAVPKVVLDQERLKIWESSAREEFSLASYNTWFLKAARDGLQAIKQNKLVELSQKDKIEEADWDQLWKELSSMQGLIDAAGIGTKKIADNAVSDIGGFLLTRRDAWLKSLVEDKVITKQDAWDLRMADINEPTLFNQESVERIHDSSQKRKSDTISISLLENVMRDKQKGRGGKQSFRGGPSGFNSGSFPNPGRGRGGPSTFGRGRGSRGRGGRGKSNSFNIKPDFSKSQKDTQPKQ